METGKSSLEETLNGVSAILALPSLIIELKAMIESRNNEISNLRDMIHNISSNIKGEDRYMSAEEARSYLGMSKGTFEKYRFSSKDKIKAYPLDGKHWFKKSDLDRFMSLYGMKKSLGLA